MQDMMCVSSLTFHEQEHFVCDRSFDYLGATRHTGNYLVREGELQVGCMYPDMIWIFRKVSE